MADQWLSIVEYARETGISDMTIRRRIRTGRISAELRDGKYFIPVTVDQSNGQISAVKGSIRATNTSSAAQTVVRNHPAPDRTIPRVVAAAQPAPAKSSRPGQGVVPPNVGPLGGVEGLANQVRPSSVAPFGESQFAQESLAKPLIDAGMASVEARSLIEFCHRALEQAKSTVASVEARYAARIDALNAQIAQRDQELKSLHQQVEDLQLLVQILEKKK